MNRPYFHIVGLLAFVHTFHAEDVLLIQRAAMFKDSSIIAFPWNAGHRSPWDNNTWHDRAAAKVVQRAADKLATYSGDSDENLKMRQSPCTSDRDYQKIHVEGITGRFTTQGGKLKAVNSCDLCGWSWCYEVSDTLLPVKILPNSCRYHVDGDMDDKQWKQAHLASCPIKHIGGGFDTRWDDANNDGDELCNTKILADVPVPPKIKCATLSYPVDLWPQDLLNCNHLIKRPCITQPSFGLDSCNRGQSSNTNMYAKVAAKVDHVYYLCMRCAEVQIPSIVAKDKISMVPGAGLDTCLKDTLECHGYKATKAHKFIIAHAKSQGFGSVAVFEEDFSVIPGCNRPMDDEEALLSYLDIKTSGVVRLSWAFSHGFNNSHPFHECPEDCWCKKKSDVICQTSPGCPHMSSAAGYVVKSTGYDAILGGHGIIDLTNFASGSSSVIIKPIGYEAGKEDRINDWIHFRANCLFE